MCLLIGVWLTLSAENKGVDLDIFSEKSEEERTGSNLDKISDRFEKMMNVSDRRMMEMSDGSESDVRSNVSSSSRVERRRVLRERGEISRPGLDVEVDVMRERRSSEIQRSKFAQDFDGMAISRDHEIGRKPGFVREGGSRERSEMENGWRGSRHAKDSSFDRLSNSSYDIEDHSRSRNDGNGMSNVDFDGDERVELLRQLDELKYKLSLSGNLNEKGKEMAPADRRMPPQDPYAPPLMRRQEMEERENGFYPPRYAPSHVQGYGNPSRSHLYSRGASEVQGSSFQIPPSRGYVSGPFMDDGMGYVENRMEVYPPNFSRHHPSCSCYDCRAKSQVPNPVMHDMASNYQESHHNRRILDQPPLRHHASQNHSRWPSDVNSEVDGFVRPRPRRANFGGVGGKHCLPIASGAPFLTCNSCFETLLLPEKVVKKNGSRKKLRCGGCSSLISFVVSGKKIVVSFDVESEASPQKVKTDIPIQQNNVPTSQIRTTFSSEDYDNSSYDFHSMDKDTKPIQTRNRHSTSTLASEAEEETTEPVLPREDKGPQSLLDHFEHSNKYHVKKESVEGNRSGRSEKSKLGAIKQMLRKESSATEIDISSNEFSNTGSTFESSEASRGGRGGSSFFAGIMGSFKDSQRSEDGLKQDHANVTVNGHLMTERLLRKAQRIAGPVQPGHYWYTFS